jgi:hypothetical protein
MIAIMNIDEGTVMGRQVSGFPLSDAEHYFGCPLCGGYVDMRDRVWLENTKSRCRTRRKIGRSSASLADRQIAVCVQII